MTRSAPSPAARRAADVLERLLLEPEFRSRFRRAPAATLERSGFADLARDLRGDGRALQTLEARESRSSVAGVLMAAAGEGIGLIDRAGRLEGDAADALHATMARPAIRRLTHPIELPRETSGGVRARLESLWARARAAWR
jgi:hypothetical protein